MNNEEKNQNTTAATEKKTVSARPAQVFAAKKLLAGSPAAKELRYFLDAKAVGDIDRLKPYLADDIVYVNSGMTFELRGIEAVANKLALLTFIIVEGADALFAMVTGPSGDDPEKRKFKAGTPCIVLKYVRDQAAKDLSLAFFELNDEGKISRLETVYARDYEYIIFYPQQWQGWSRRVIRTTIKYDKDGNKISETDSYVDGSPVKEVSDDVESEN